MLRLMTDSVSFMAIGYRRDDVKDIADLFRFLKGTISIIGPEDIRDDIDSIMQSIVIYGKQA
jgi:hypothetical protein